MQNKKSIAWDTVVLAGWFVLGISIVVFRQSYIGDGVRHVGTLLDRSYPQLGAPRWILFPALLFSWLKPLQTLGLVHSVKEALPWFAFGNVLCAGVYLEALRRWLKERSIEPLQRTAALCLAASMTPLLLLGTDTAEPMAAGACVALGLWQGSRGRLIPASLWIAVGSLIYQAAVLGFFALPLATGIQVWKEKSAYLQSAAVLVGLAGVMIGLQMGVQHYSFSLALDRLSSGTQNAFYRDLMSGPPLKGALLTLGAGFPQGFVYLPNMQGLRGLFHDALLATPHGLLQTFRLCVGVSLWSGCMIGMLRRREWLWGLAVVGLALLPTKWNYEYGYVKFYLLFPLLAAYALSRLNRPRLGWTAIVLLVALNGSALYGELYQARQRFHAMTTLYAGATPKTAWVTPGWAPDFYYLWPGSLTSMMGTLGSEEAQETTLQSAGILSGTFLESLHRSFCTADQVWTSDWTQDRAAVTLQWAKQFHFPIAHLERTFWRDANDGSIIEVDHGPDVYVFSKQRQQEICHMLQSRP